MKNTLIQQLHNSTDGGRGDASNSNNAELKKLLARCFLRLGEWQETVEGLKENVITQVLQ